MAKAYYNEIDKKAAAMLRQLIKDGIIADGDVDERSITEVKPSDLEGYYELLKKIEKRAKQPKKKR